VIEVPRNGTAVKPDQVQAVLDVGDLVDPGFHNVPVKIVSPDVAIRSLSPASVTLSLDRLEERVVRSASTTSATGTRSSSTRRW